MAMMIRCEDGESDNDKDNDGHDHGHERVHECDHAHAHATEERDVVVPISFAECHRTNQNIDKT